MTHEASGKLCLFVALLFLVNVGTRIRCMFATVRAYIREEASVTTALGYYQTRQKVRKFAWLYVRGDRVLSYSLFSITALNIAARNINLVIRKILEEKISSCSTRHPATFYYFALSRYIFERMFRHPHPPRCEAIPREFMFLADLRNSSVAKQGPMLCRVLWSFHRRS